MLLPPTSSSTRVSRRRRPARSGSNRGLLWYIASRVAAVVPLILAVTFVCFLLVHMAPGDAWTRLEANPDVSRSTLEAFRARFGLDRPILVQYGLWLRNVVLRGDFGLSFESALPAFDALFLSGRLAWTVLVAGSTMLVALAFAIPLGVWTAARPHGVVDRVGTALEFVLLSVPAFLLGLLLLWFLVAVRVGDLGLGVGGLFDPRYLGAPWSWGKVGNLLWHLWPVWAAAGAAEGIGWARQTRGSLQEALADPYVVTARSKGLAERSVIWKHALRNAANPLVSMAGLSLPRLVSGSLVAAVVFNLPTVERAFWQAVQAQDRYVVLAGLSFFTVFLAVGNLTADLLLVALDPRIRREA
jgi:peptide/nickel transport system permease protein